MGNITKWVWVELTKSRNKKICVAFMTAGDKIYKHHPNMILSVCVSSAPVANKGQVIETSRKYISELLLACFKLL